MTTGSKISNTMAIKTLTVAPPANDSKPHLQLRDGWIVLPGASSTSESGDLSSGCSITFDADVRGIIQNTDHKGGNSAQATTIGARTKPDPAFLTWKLSPSP